MRREFEMTEEDLAKIMNRINTARGMPLIMLQVGMPESPQEAANAAWAELGQRMGFKPMTVLPCSGKSDRCFTAEPV
jgi:hypothetical protein